MIIKAENILKIEANELVKYKVHLACWDGKNHPLDVCSRNWNSWVDWNEYRGEKDRFNREYIFSLMQYYNEPNKWLFGGIFCVVKRFDDHEDTTVGYQVALTALHKELIGRLIIDFDNTAIRNTSLLLENYYNDFVVSEILKTTFGEIIVP